MEGVSRAISLFIILLFVRFTHPAWFMFFCLFLGFAETFGNKSLENLTTIAALSTYCNVYKVLRELTPTRH